MPKTVAIFSIVLLTAAFFAGAFLFQDACVPDGCLFSGFQCNDTGCINETVSQHIAERSSFFVFLPIAVFLFLSVALFVCYFFRPQTSRVSRFFQIKQIQERLCVRFPNFFIELFSSGILNPKIFSQA